MLELASGAEVIATKLFHAFGYNTPENRIVLLLRYVQPERLLRVESLPDVTGFFATLQPPVTPLLPSFWIIRTSPIALSDFLWSKFWTGLVPVLVLTAGLTVAGSELLGIDPFLKLVSAVAIVFMSLALVGLATGLGARYPRFAADNATQVAGSYGGVMFMIGAVLFVLVTIVLTGWPSMLYLFHQVRNVPLSTGQQVAMGACFATAALISVATWWLSMRSGVRALQTMDSTPG